MHNLISERQSCSGYSEACEASPDHGPLSKSGFKANITIATRAGLILVAALFPH